MKLNYYILCSLLFFYSGFGQTLKDTIHLSEIEISPSLFTLKDKSFESGKKIEHTDTLLKKIFLLNALSDALNFQTSVFVKNYAPGGIGTASIRGGNASQTSVLWNGININHPMLGQSDFSQLSVSLFDNISVEYGASSSLWGSGAMNGSIRLENNFSLKEKFLFSYRRGSFNSNYWFGKFNSSIKNIKYYVSGNLQSSENNYSIGDSIQLKYAKFNMQDWNAGISYAFKNFHRISYHFWVHNGKNNQPNNYLNATYATLLTNQNIRNVVDYLFQEKSLKIGIKAAYLIDNLNYTDSVANINSKSKVHTVQTEENIYKPLTKNSQIVFGHQWVYNYAITNNYLNNSFINRHSVFIGYEHIIRKLAFNAIVRKEWANIAADIPLTSNVGVSYTIFRPFRLKAQLSKFYRLPTMNDLYWKGSRNQNLKPEDGYCYEGGIVIHYQWLFS
ncbi:MAG: TonB-dependent receptor, partial [Bacteroidia bacterium]|nr:TonB-dependent receptor [Bacteroidia bacterium]